MLHTIDTYGCSQVESGLNPTTIEGHLLGRINTLPSNHPLRYIKHMLQTTPDTMRQMIRCLLTNFPCSQCKTPTKCFDAGVCANETKAQHFKSCGNCTTPTECSTNGCIDTPEPTTCGAHAPCHNCKDFVYCKRFGCSF